MAGHGSPPPEDKANHPARKVSQLKSAMTRAGNQVWKIESEYGAHDIPPTSPLHAKVTKARTKHAEARRAYGEATR